MNTSNNIWVIIISGENVEDIERYENYVAEPVTVNTDKGTSIESDFVFKCVGLATNTQAYKDSLGKNIAYLFIAPPFL